ncbi:protein-L-isoaspartate O-methyltransferase family protein [Lichenicoccus roseus]|uniref:Protein-L-isoaspartate O-methyltransferase n=1 Tax=Lichenicoccus roseus TaxID=2683649 RepID=A0A5R9JDT6_9PROT|nr:protein-L-isoaspartate O-methyltransferase [Lichenicoccus roseus]TLU72458.1 protein-L-isoaspartate O-methyltransferase [Lichenicoccus roseus]
MKTLDPAPTAPGATATVWPAHIGAGLRGSSDAVAIPPGDFQHLVQARNRMVDTQIRPLQVSDPRIIKAMRDIPRERFVPADRVAIAYADRGVPLAAGRVLTEPRIIARLLQVAVPLGGERALVLAAGTGYSAVLLARLGLSVVALEQDAALAGTGAALCAELAPTVRYVTGTLADGYPDAAPYDLILIDGAVRSLPDSLAGQLAPGGRLATVLWPEGKVGSGVLAEHSGHSLRARQQFDATTPLIPELMAAPRFSF